MIRPFRHWPIILAFAVLLLLVDPVARGVSVCLLKHLSQCPSEITGERK